MFADKPKILDDIKHNMAQYIHLSKMYRLRLSEKLEKALESG